MGAQAEGFLRFMEQYTEYMAEMAVQEDKKYSALISNDLQRMDKAISEQQAMLMKLEKLEEQRAQMQKDAGWESLTFQEIVDRVEDEEEKRSFKAVFSEISRLLEQIRYGNEKAVSFAQMSLHINGLLDQDGGQGDQQQYTANKERKSGKDSDSSGSVFETKV